MDPRTRRLCGLAGLLVVVPAGAGALVLAGESNLRQNGVPWCFSAGALLLLACLWGVESLHDTSRRDARRVGFVLTAIALAGVAAFFLGLGVEDSLNSLFDTGRFISDNDALTGLGTLAASILTLVALPVGLITFGIGVLRAGIVSGWTAAVPLVLSIGVIGGALAAGATRATLPSVVTLGVATLCAASLGRYLLRT